MSAPKQPDPDAKCAAAPAGTVLDGVPTDPAHEPVHRLDGKGSAVGLEAAGCGVPPGQLVGGSEPEELELVAPVSPRQLKRLDVLGRDGAESDRTPSECIRGSSSCTCLLAHWLRVAAGRERDL